MKKLLGFLMAALIVIPLINVKAIEGNYYTYTVGQEVNFYMYEGDSVGSRTIILTEEGANSQYVRALVTGVLATSTTPQYVDTEFEQTADPKNFKTTHGYNDLMNVINQAPGMGGLNGAPYARNVAAELSLLTLDDLTGVFGATPSGENYTIDWSKWGSVFNSFKTSAAGLYTQTVTDDGQNVWVVEFQKNDAGENVGAIVKKISISDTTKYAYVPVLYVDKTYDCTERDAQDKFACYDCDGEYIWTEIGKQADTCNLVEDVKVQSNCVKNVQTGLNQYFVQFGLIAGVCALALVAVNRKNLFRGI